MWTNTFDFSPRHCWPTGDGTFIIDPIDGTVCTNPEDHPYSRGKAEYMRWLSAFGKLVPNVTYNVPDGWITVGPHSEEYGNIILTVFEDGKAHVSVNDKYADQAREATHLVEVSYAEELVNV